MLKRFETFCITIAHLNKSLQKLRSLTMGQYGLKGTHTMCVYYCGKNSTKGVTLKELASLCEEDKAGISRAVKELKALGFIQKTETNSKVKSEYRTKYILTEAGLAVYEDLKDKIIEAVTAGSVGLNESQRYIFYNAIERIAVNLDNLTERKQKS